MAGGTSGVQTKWGGINGAYHGETNLGFCANIVCHMAYMLYDMNEGDMIFNMYLKV
jgi:hypothetical protein